MAQWLVSLVATDSTTSSSTAEAPKVAKGVWASQMMFTKTKDIIRQEYYDQKQNVWTTWCVPGFQITVWPDGRHYILQTEQKINPSGPPPILYTDFSKTDFQGFEWISIKNYAGIQNIQGRKCIVFKDDVLVDPEYHITALGLAYIDFDSRLPVELILGSTEHTYEYKKPPAAMLTPPPLVQSLLSNRVKEMELATFHPVKAF